jgi:tetratricopeptide (TPR) repeat protein
MMTPSADSRRPQYNFPTTGNHVPEDKDQRLVQTPYGKGMVIRTRAPDANGILVREIELVDWNAQSQQGNSNTGPIRPTTLYSATPFPSVAPAIGDDVLTLYGRGRVTKLHDDDDDDSHRMVTVVLSSWRLAGRSRVTCTLTRSQLQVVRARKLYEMSVYEKVEHARTLKAAAAQQFSAKDYPTALLTYARAVDAVKYVQHKKDSSNEVRADLLLIMITCSNNAGTCCTQLRQWEEAFKLAMRASVLIDALQEKAGLKIHALLQKEGTADSTIFGEWKVKSCLLMARALSEKGEEEQAMELLKTAHEIIAKFTADEYAQQPALKSSVQRLVANAKEVKKLHATCKEQRKAHLKKEKMRAQAMFGGFSKTEPQQEEEKKEATPVVVEEKSRGVSFTEESRETLSETEMASSQEDNPTKAVETSATNNNGEANKPKNVRPKRRVSFAENVKDKKEEPPKDLIDELEWYQDSEVLTGLAIFGATVATSMVGLSYLLSKKR